MLDEKWWESLDAAWKKLFEESFEIDGPGKVKKLGRVKEVYLDDDFASATLEPLGALSKLEEFNCDAPKVANLAPLAKCARLKTVRISSKKVKDYSPLGYLQNLQDLDLSGTSLSDLSMLSSALRLQRLDLSGTRVTDLAPLAGLKHLESLDASGTKVKDLAPLAGLRKLNELKLRGVKAESWEPLRRVSLRSLEASGSNLASLDCLTDPGLSILGVANTPVPFREVLGVWHRRRDSLGGSLYSNFGGPAELLAALEAIDFPLDDLEESLTILVHNALTSALKSEDEQVHALAPALLERWLSFPASKVAHAHLGNFFGNAVATLVRCKGSDSLVKQVLALVPDPVTDRVLAFNLACLFATRGAKPQTLKYVKAALACGQSPERFLEDADFAPFTGDADFKKVLGAPQVPDPETDTVAWWNTLSEDLRERIDTGGDVSSEPSQKEIFKAIHAKDFNLCVFALKSLEPLRGLVKLKSLEVEGLEAKSLDALGTLAALERISLDAGDELRAYDLAPLAACTRLSHVKLKRVADCDVEVLAKLPRLRSVSLWHSTVKSLEPLRALKKLCALELELKQDAAIDSTLFASMSELEDLTVIGLDSLEALARLKKLKSLRFSVKAAAPVSLTPLANLTALVGLQLESEFVDPTPLFGLKSLRRLWLPRNVPAAPLKKLLKKHLPACEVRP